MNDLAPALKATETNTLESWIHEFLLGPGKNKDLSDGLKKQKRFWIGPKEINLDLIPRISGPEDGLEYKMEKIGWDTKTKKMDQELKEGWKPAPLIAEYRSGVLSLRDGNHRRMALELAGFKKYWVIIWFNSEEDRNKYLS